MTIHLDTNILPQKGALKGGAVTALLRISRARGMTVSIPEIVLHESTNKRLERVREEVAKVQKAIAEASSYVHIEPIYLPEPLDLAQEWEDELRGVFTILATENGDASEAFWREARRQPPASGGRGGRDALIWLTVLRESQKSGERTYLVTNNTSDFSQVRGGRTLHPELQKEAEQVGAEVILCTSVEDLLGYISDKVEFSVKLEDIRSYTDGDDVISELLLGPWSDLLDEEADRPWEPGAILEIDVVGVKTHRAHQVDKTLLAWTSSECTLRFRYTDDTFSHIINVRVDAWVVYEDDKFASIEVVTSSRLTPGIS